MAVSSKHFISFLRQQTTIVAAIVLVNVGFPAVGGAQEQASPASTVVPKVTVITAAMQTVVSTLLVSGSLVPREEIDVGVDLDGYRITEIDAEVGDKVKAGQVLARLSTDLLEIQLAQNDASLAHSDAEINQAKSQIAEAVASETEAVAALGRNSVLKQKGIVSEDTFEQKTAAATQAGARRQQEEQALAVAQSDKQLTAAKRRELQLSYAKAIIRAPADGIVLTRSARSGAVVSSTGVPLFTIARDGAIELSAEVAEPMIDQISLGQIVSVTPQGGSETIKGVVRLVSPTINQNTRLGSIRVALPLDVPLKSGGYARGEIDIAEQHAVALPQSAILGSGDRQLAQVVVSGRIETRNLKTGISSNGVTAVTSGVVSGETVVLRAGTFVHKGQLVIPVLASVPGDGQ
jgi:HlyD family secretion protein